MTAPVNIGGTTYRYQKELYADAVSRFPRGGRDWRPWEPDEWWCDLLGYSPSLQQKIDVELDGIFEGFIHQFTNANHLALKGHGDRLVSFGWSDCVHAAFGKTKLPADTTSAWLHRAKRGMRDLVKGQIIAAKTVRTLHGKIQCELTNEWLATAAIHADHHPDPFDAIANQFVEDVLTERGEVPDLVHASASSGTADHFVDPTLNDRWVEFHRLHARYRMINATANLKKGRGVS
ncbi:hypothetical protein HTK96_02885 [Brevundimonas vesicularis]|uniref:hypothetical protein n=1 Tax=Brevundimonas vesicularis TaxID=41276 RepID=UPI0015748FDE|nr:hypothetical protein [Brevundimonas vesicularis]NSX32312.1 hypothetical protein [Brevundimonas vesicularis]